MKSIENEACYHAYEIAASMLQSGLDEKDMDRLCELNHITPRMTERVKRHIERIIKALSAKAERYDKKRKI